MKTVTLDVRSPDDAGRDFVAAWKTGRTRRNARISFATPELLWAVLTAKRWEILKSMCSTGPLTVREIAHQVGRDIKSVHMDLTALLKAGVLERTESGRAVFPYDAIKVEFLLRAA